MPVVSDYTALLSGLTWNGPGVSGRPTILTYSFETAAQPYLGDGYSAQFKASFAPLSLAEQAAARAALDMWAQASGLQVFEAPAGQGDIRFAKYDFQFAPAEQQGAGGFTSFPALDVRSTVVSDNLIGGDVFLSRSLTATTPLLLHEIGHALGLKHPFDATIGPTLDTALDDTAHTVLSYTNRPGFQADHLGPLDIQAVQFVYGGPSSDGANLASWSWNPITFVLTQTAGGGNDTVLGVGTRDVIGGGAGDDVLAGMNGDDQVAGGAGADRLFGAAGADRLDGEDGGDTVYGGEGGDTISGGAGTNYLRGDEGNDSIVGGEGFDDINGNMGDDTCVSGGGDDWVVGGKDNDSLTGSAGQNLVYGNLGADTCEGGDGNDIVRGGQDNDIVRGGNGDDFVSGDKGDDTMTGGAGADLFHSFSGAGIDRVTDFSLAQGDRVMLDLGATFTLRQAGGDTIVDLGGGDQVILVGVSMSTLTAGAIFFG